MLSKVKGIENLADQRDREFIMTSFYYSIIYDYSPYAGVGVQSPRSAYCTTLSDNLKRMGGIEISRNHRLHQAGQLDS